MLVSSWEQKKKSDGKAIGVSLGCSPYWPISEQRGQMNPVPATKKPLEKSRGFFVLLKVKRFSTSKEVEKILERVVRFLFF